MKYQIYRAAVIGAGTMGAAIAAHLANAGVPTVLLDIVPDKLTPEEEQKGLTLQDKVVRNRIVAQGLDRALKSRPASFFTNDLVSLVQTGNLEDDFDQIAHADWVIEVIVERLDIKRQLMERIDAVRRPDSIISTNTSGIPVTSIAEGRSESFRQHFLGTHFFNPPRYLKLLEIIPTNDTLPEVVEAISHFGEYRLGKGIVMCKDTPNFIANRMITGTGVFAVDYILQNGYTVEEVDAITGPVIGRPKTATFRLLDLVGLDVWDHVGRNLAPLIPHDKLAVRYLNSEPVNNLIKAMLGKGWLGLKTKAGFYKEVRQPDGTREFWALDLKTLEHRAPQKARFESIGKAKDLATVGERLIVLLASDDRAGQLVRALTYQGMMYATTCLPEVADTPKPIDDATRWGFNHEAGPFETWDMLGVAETCHAMQEAGYPPASWVEEMLAKGYSTFYQYESDRKVGVYDVLEKEYVPIQRPPDLIVLKELKPGKVLDENPGASLIDLGDGVACVEFHAKMNILDEDILSVINTGLDRAEVGEFDALVLGTEAEHFTTGVNLAKVLMGAKMGAWDQLSDSIKLGQGLYMRMRYFPKPVVTAPLGYTFAGGLEMVMHSSRVVAACEAYVGLVEVGMGLIPAWGGTTEMVRRIVNPAMRTQNAIVLPFLQRVFELIGMAKVATSAEEARSFGFLGPADRVVMNRDHLLAEAKQEALHMAETGYRPPPPEKIYAAGRDALAAMRVGIYMMKQGSYITEYESVIGEKLASVLTGGELSQPAWVDEQYFLDLEREAILSLMGQEKTQERIYSFFSTGRAVRN